MPSTRREIVSSGPVVLLILLMAASLALGQDQGRFTVREINGVWWLIDPHGAPLFSRGVCCVNTGISWEQYTNANPGYAAWQHHSSAEAWAGATMDSLRSWGFTTIGGWSDIDLFLRCSTLDLPFTVVLHCGSTAGVPWFDMWDPEVIKRVDDVAREQILKTRDHPLLIGYYSDNELGWWNAMLFKMTWEHAPESGARSRLVGLVREHYRDSWSAMVKDFDPDSAWSFGELAHRGRLFLRPGGNGIVVVKRFIAMLAERYYTLMEQTIHKYSTRALYLGDRYQSFYYPEVAQAAARHVDVVSTNLGTHFYDGAPARYYLSTLYELTGKPIMVGEYYMAAMENRSGNKNTGLGFPTVGTQAERVKGLRTTASWLARTPYVIGADWFQFSDEPTHGRFDGEDFNFGLVDIAGKPYEGLTEAFRTFDWTGCKSNPVRELPDAATGIPPAPPDPGGGGKREVLLKDWDRIHGFVKPSTASPLADCYVCWSRDTLYIGFYLENAANNEYYRSGSVPDGERTLIRLWIGKEKNPLEFRFGAAIAPTSSDPKAAIVSLPVPHPNRLGALLQIPCTIFGKTTFASGDIIQFHVLLRSAARAYTVEWRLTSRLIAAANQ